MSLRARPISEMVDAGVLAYRNKDFKTAIQYLQDVLDAEPRHWRAKLYLGMAFYYSGDLLMASGQFRTLCTQCTDQDIQRKAVAAMTGINSEIKAMPDMTCTIKKPSMPPVGKPKDLDVEVDDAVDMEWVQQDLREHT